VRLRPGTPMQGAVHAACHLRASLLTTSKPGASASCHANALLGFVADREPLEANRVRWLSFTRHTTLSKVAWRRAAAPAPCCTCGGRRRARRRAHRPGARAARRARPGSPPAARDCAPSAAPSRSSARRPGRGAPSWSPCRRHHRARCSAELTASSARPQTSLRTACERLQPLSA